jgi:hypothetical protein
MSTARPMTPAEREAALAEACSRRVPADPRPGEHEAVITDARLDVSRSGHPTIACSLTDATDGTPLPLLYLSLNPRGRTFLEANLRALGIELPPGGAVTVSASSLVGRRVRVWIEPDRDGILRARVSPGSGWAAS